jgi:hypothetical protein
LGWQNGHGTLHGTCQNCGGPLTSPVSKASGRFCSDRREEAARHRGRPTSEENPNDSRTRVDHPRFIIAAGRTFERVDDENLWRDPDGYELRIRDLDLGGADILYEFKAPHGHRWWPYVVEDDQHPDPDEGDATPPFAQHPPGQQGAPAGPEQQQTSIQSTTGVGTGGCRISPQRRKCPPAMRREATFARKPDWQRDLL